MASVDTMAVQISTTFRYARVPRRMETESRDTQHGVALFVDGPNVLRDEFDVDLDDVREAAGRS